MYAYYDEENKIFYTYDTYPFDYRRDDGTYASNNAANSVLLMDDIKEWINRLNQELDDYMYEHSD
jgi:hypothetical protein